MSFLDSLFTAVASALKTPAGQIDVSSTNPVVGYVLKVTDPAHAGWQPESAGPGGGAPVFESHIVTADTEAVLGNSYLVIGSDILITLPDATLPGVSGQQVRVVMLDTGRIGPPGLESPNILYFESGNQIDPVIVPKGHYECTALYDPDENPAGFWFITRSTESWGRRSFDADWCMPDVVPEGYNTFTIGTSPERRVLESTGLTTELPFDGSTDDDNYEVGDIVLIPYDLNYPGLYKVTVLSGLSWQLEQIDMFNLGSENAESEIRIRHGSIYGGRRFTTNILEDEQLNVQFYEPAMPMRRYPWQGYQLDGSNTQLGTPYPFDSLVPGRVNVLNLSSGDQTYTLRLPSSFDAFEGLAAFDNTRFAIKCVQDGGVERTATIIVPFGGIEDGQGGITSPAAVSVKVGSYYEWQLFDGPTWRLVDRVDIGGGGAVDSIASADGSIVVSSPTGAVDLAVDESALVVGGDGSNTLAALLVNQARGLRETAGPTTLTMAAVAVGQLLKRVGTTIVGASVAESIASADGSIIVSSPTGSVDLAVDESALVVGGDGSNTLAALIVNQARGLRETAGPTTLTMGAVANGQVLTRSGATIVGATIPIPSGSPSTGPVDSGHVDNAYFVDTPADTFPAGWNVYRDSSGGSTVLNGAVIATGTPTVGVDGSTLMAASGNDASKTRYNNNSRRPGWFYYQAPHENGGIQRFAWGKKHASNLPADFVIVSRFAWGGDPDGSGSANNNGQFLWGVCADSSNTPLGGAVVGGAQAFIQLRPNSTASGNTELSLIVANGTTQAVVTRSLGVVSLSHTLGGWLKIWRKGGNVYGFIGNDAGSWSKIGTILVGTGATGGTFRWWLATHISRADGADSFAPWVGFDRMMRYDQSADVL